MTLQQVLCFVFLYVPGDLDVQSDRQYALCLPRQLYQALKPIKFDGPKRCGGPFLCVSLSAFESKQQVMLKE